MGKIIFFSLKNLHLFQDIYARLQIDASVVSDESDSRILMYVIDQIKDYGRNAVEAEDGFCE